MKSLMKAACRVTGLACLLYIATSQEVLAQQLRLSGTVSDGSGLIPGAGVTLRDPNGVITELKTNEMGQYNFTGLRPGAYEITVTREGFSAASRAFTLSTESLRINMTLKVSAIFTSIDVNDSAGRGTASGMEIPNREIP